MSDNIPPNKYDDSFIRASDLSPLNSRNARPIIFHPNLEETNIGQSLLSASIPTSSSSSSFLPATSTQLVTIPQHTSANDHQPSEQAIITYNPFVQGLMSQVAQVKQNKLNESTRIQYLSANTAFIIFLFHNFPNVLQLEYLEMYRSMQDNINEKLFVKGVKDSLKMNTICPFLIEKIDATLFMTYLVSLKRADGTYFTFSCYDGKRSAIVHLISESSNHLSNIVRDALSDMLVSLKNHCKR